MFDQNISLEKIVKPSESTESKDSQPSLNSESIDFRSDEIDLGKVHSEIGFDACSQMSFESSHPTESYATEQLPSQDYKLFAGRFGQNAELEQEVLKKFANLQRSVETNQSHMGKVGFTGLRKEALERTLSEQVGPTRSNGAETIYRWSVSETHNSDTQELTKDVAESALKAHVYATSTSDTRVGVSSAPGGVLITYYEETRMDVIQTKETQPSYDLPDREKTGRVEQLMHCNKDDFKKSYAGHLPITHEIKALGDDIIQIANDMLQCQEEAMQLPNSKRDLRHELINNYNTLQERKSYLTQILAFDIAQHALNFIFGK